MYSFQGFGGNACECVDSDCRASVNAEICSGNSVLILLFYLFFVNGIKCIPFYHGKCITVSCMHLPEHLVPQYTNNKNNSVQVCCNPTNHFT